MKKRILFLCLILFITTISAQNASNYGQIKLTHVEKNQQQLSPQNLLFSVLKPMRGTEFRILKTKTDKLGFTHTTYQQYYNGIKVVLGQLKVHQKNSLIVSYNGAYFPPTNVRTTARVRKNQVIAIAKKFSGTNDVFWATEDGISKTNTPDPQLVLLPNRKKASVNLAYAIGVGSSSPKLTMGIIYVDAQTGTVLKYKNLVFTCFEKAAENNHVETPLFVAGTGTTAYSGSQTIQTTLDNTDYILYDQTRATTGSSHDAGIATKSGIATVNINHSNAVTDYNNSGIITEFTDNNNTWNAAELSNDEDQYALDAHWGAQVVYDYFNDVHGRNSYDDNNSAIVSYVHFDTDYTNAAWLSFTNNRGFMIYGDGASSFTPLTTLDVAAHEIGHGITNNTADLDYELESGALNEGFSDIWAMVIDNYANNNLGTTKDIGNINDENGGGTIRSMSSPNTYGQPDTYGGTNWVDTSSCTPDGDPNSATYNDYCGVHTNSGVINYWFWLLSQGGSGSNDNGDAFSVTAIGMDDAAAIAYRMQNTYLTATSDYADARTAGIQAAVDLYGACSTQEQEVTNAFYAVGVGTAYTVVNPSVTSQPSNASTCEGDATTFSADGSDYDTLQWQVDDGNGWANITDGSTYSGATTTTLTITSPAFSLDGYDYRLQFINSCSSVNSNSVALEVDEYPTASVVAENETCTGGDGALIFTFSDNSNRTGIEFSTDGGSTYPYEYGDDLGSQTVSSLTAATYNVWVRWGNSECPLELGDYTVNTGTTPTASVSGTTNESCTLNDGSIELTFSDSATETQIEFSVDGGVNYDYTFDDTLGTASITSLAPGDYDVWVSYNGNCAVDLGTSTVGSDAPVTTVTAVDSSIGGTDGGFSVTFENNPSRGLLKFSIDGGVNYDYPFNDNLGSGSITGLAAATYNVWVVWGNDECPKELGDYTINESADYVSIPDSNFESALNDLGYDDLLGDNKVPLALINTVDWLNVVNKGITDLTGIESFTALTNFDCAYNSLISIDMSSNLLLDTFRCDNNVLTSVDVSANTGLLYFDCFNNSLETIDVSNNLLLLDLEANNNSLTSLDVSANPALEVLECSDNNLTYLNFKNGNNMSTVNSEFEATGNTSLTCIEVDDAAYSTGAWANIDVGVIFSSYCSYTTIPDANFEAALEALGYDDISGDGQVPTSLINVVTTLDVDGESISDLTGIEDFIALETLDADNNTLMSIDLSALSNLKSLNLQYNSLTSLDVTNNLNLETLAFRDNTVGSIDLTNNSKLESLAFQYNSITTIDLSTNILLYHIACRDNGLTSLDLTNNPAMVNIYSQNNAVTSVDLSNNPNLVIVAFPNNALTSFNMQNGNNIIMSGINIAGNSELTCVLVDDVLYSNGTWTSNVDNQTSFNDVSCVAYTAIPDANFEARLEELGYDDISGDGQAPTAVIEAVTTLHVNSQSISDLTGIEAFTALETLNCNTNSITSLDLSSNTNLSYLNCDSNSLTSLDLSGNLMLTTLYCNSNDIGTINVASNNLLETIGAYGNLLTSIDVTNNLLISYLDVSNNSLEAIDVSTNTALTNLNLFGNPTLSVDLSNNTTLAFLDVGDSSMQTIDISNNLALLEFYSYDSSLTGSLDLSNHSLLTDVDLTNSDFSNVDIRNGNNTNILSFTAIGNSNLTCIQVDDLNNDYSSWIKEAGTSFIETDYCDYTAIPDANFEAALEALGYDDISADGQVPTALIEVVTSLDIRDLSISDLTGLEDFTALVTLLCRANGINTIDVSQNLLLETLTANNNSIGTIDLSNNTALKSVNLGANGLSTLDVSSNLLLESLSLQSNGGLTTLDISNNTLLKELKTYSSNIATLDVSNNIALQTLQAYSSPIATIDVTNNPDLKDFRVHNTNITTLDLSNNPDIEQLRVNDTGITSLDLSNVVALQKFYANDMSLNSLNVQNGNNGNITVFRLTDNPSLSCILVDDADYSTDNWDEIDTGLMFSDTYCRYTAIPDANFESWLNAQGYDDISSDGQVPTALIEVVTSVTAQFEDIIDFTGIEDFTALESLTISYNSFTALDVSNNVNLTFLNCGYSSLANLDVSNNLLLETLWINSTNVSTLDLSQNANFKSLTGSSMNNLTTLNMQNGNNTNVTNFTTVGNSNLTCILVDDLVNDYSSWSKDVTTSLSDTYCGYTLIPDANFEAELEALGYDDISGDGQVPTALIEVVTSLDVSSKSISDLTGIEDFIALTYLDCEVNDLTSLDLSNNTLLEEIDCDANSSLTSLNFGNNTNLKTIICNNNSMLTTLDLSNNTGLESVQISSNGLTSLNVGNLINLKTLYCSGNSLSSLDVTQSVNLENLICAENTINALDVSNNTLLTYLSVADNNLTTIDVTNNTALLYLLLNENGLTTLDVTNNTNLKWLYTYSNTLAAINTSQNLVLEKLWTYDNEIIALDVTNNIALTELMCYDNMLTSLDVSNSPLLNWLYCSDNSITSLDLTNNTALTSFTCNDNALTSLNLQNGNNTNLSFRIMNNNPDLICILVDDADYSTINWDIDVDGTASFNETSCDFVIVDVDVFLQGALINPNTGEENFMRNDLSLNGYIESTSPYGDGAEISKTVAGDVSNDNALVDWIWVELRDANNSTTVIAGQSAVLQRDGDIVATDDDLVTPLTFENVPAGDYYIVIKHRNHLGIMSSTAITLNQVSTTIDFTDANNEITYGSNAQTTFGMPTDVVAMWCGNANEDSIIQYSGTDPDTPDILSTVLNDAGNFLNFPTYVVSGYNSNDVNMDGNTQYSGTDPDVPFILQNVLAHPSNFLGFSTYQIIEQLPEVE